MNNEFHEGLKTLVIQVLLISAICLIAAVGFS
jgi:hypothetical protein